MSIRNLVSHMKILIKLILALAQGQGLIYLRFPQMQLQFGVL